MKKEIREYLARKIWRLGITITESSCKIRKRHIDYYNRELLELRCAVCGIKLDKLP
jgi:hypothetical protein